MVNGFGATSVEEELVNEKELLFTTNLSFTGIPISFRFGRIVLSTWDHDNVEKNIII